MHTLPTLDQFLQQCASASSAAYDHFCQLLARLERPDTRTEAGILLHRIVRRYHELQQLAAAGAQALPELNFSCNRLTVSAAGEALRNLELLQFPSSFSPEEWSFTFYEGLTRYPVAEFHERSVIELGCGNGWITLALALRCQPKLIYGVDINPKAIVLSRLNLYLNALDANGHLIPDSEGKHLLERVRFAESDLLGHFIAADGQSNFIPDIIVGCIPQVLNPDSDALLTIVPGQTSDEHLYSLSNYCDKQGYVEDQFGLGLIARAMEEAVSLMRPTGKLILNLGGRPGAHVLERMFLRRGFNLKKIWQTKVGQAQDTDILALVNIEKSSSHRFEFYMSHHSDEPISASTAWRYAQTGGQIYHALSVYEAELAFPSAVKTVLRQLRGASFEQARSSLDLSFEVREIAEERLSFLADLSTQLAQTVCFPYLDTSGDLAFREQISAFLRSYYRVEFEPEQILVAPTRADVLHNMIGVYQPARILIDSGLAHDTLLPHNARVEIIEAPRRVELVCRLMAQLEPQLVITALAGFEQQSAQAFAKLVEQSQSQHCLLVVDISDSFDLSSEPATNGVLQYVSESGLPAHVVLLCGLVKNRVYSDLETSFVLTQNSLILQHLEAAAELSYSRTASMNQHYYRRLLQDLLYFQRPQRLEIQRHRIAPDEARAAELPLTPGAQQAFVHPAITTNHLPMDSNTIRLDYGENCLPAPQALKAALLESFVRQHISADEIDLTPPLLQLLEQRFGLLAKAPGHLVYGGGIAPIFASLCQVAAQQQALLLMPQGGYDNFAASAVFYGVATHELATSEEQQFKLDAATLQAACTANAGRALYLYLNGPVVNPTGACYSQAELQAIFAVASQYQVCVILDTIFCGLEFAPAGALQFDQIADSHLRLLLLGGISKEFAAGGLRFGYAYSRDAALIGMLKNQKTHKPHTTLLYTVKRLIQLQLAGDAGLAEELAQQRQLLKDRAARLTACLQGCGWQVLPSQGGLFMVAAPLGWLGRSCTFATPDGSRTVSLSAENIDQALFYSVNLLINNAVWTGLPGYCRFVLSVSEAEFVEALARLQRFARMLD
jgi:methionine S-methyltransferase